MIFHWTNGETDGIKSMFSHVQLYVRYSWVNSEKRYFIFTKENWLLNGLIDFNSMPACRGLFYAWRLGTWKRRRTCSRAGVCLETKSVSLFCFDNFKVLKPVYKYNLMFRYFSNTPWILHLKFDNFLTECDILDTAYFKRCKKSFLA